MEKEVALTDLKSCSSCSCSTSKTPALALRRLMDRSLVRVDQLGILRMHDVLRDMGRDIVKRDSVRKEGRRLEEWTHLWDAGTAAKVLSYGEVSVQVLVYLFNKQRAGEAQKVNILGVESCKWSYLMIFYLCI